MILLELFDHPYEYVPEKSGSDYTFYFKDDAGKTVITNFEWWQSPRLFIFDFKRDGSFLLTGDSPVDKQAAIRVLTTVIKQAREVLDAEDKAVGIGFSSKASEGSRTSLYARMVKRLASDAGLKLVDDPAKIKNAAGTSTWIYNYERAYGADHKRFWLVRKEHYAAD